MSDLPAHPQPPPRSYEEFLEDIKTRIRRAQARAARAINTELIDVYWQIGREILARQAEEGPELGRRTPGVVQRLSADLKTAFLEHADTPCRACIGCGRSLRRGPKVSQTG